MGKANKLKRKIVMVEAMPKQKQKGNAFVGFLIILFILAGIAGIIYYLETKGITNFLDFI